MAKVRLQALDSQDLEVLATHLQDMILRVGDMVHLPSTRRFAAIGTRFCWEHVDVEKAKPKKGKSYYRTQAGFHFDSVTGVRMQGFAQDDGEALMVLLSLAFEETQDGAGVVRLSMAGGAEIELTVECIDAAMSDLSAPWPTDQLPSHEA